MSRKFRVGRQIAKEKSELVRWRNNGYSVPAPPSVKEAVLFRYRFPQGSWIETGTWKGHTTSFLSDFGQEIFTIEPELRLFEAAQSRFASIPHVTCVLGTSEQVLDEVCAQISGGPVNFWLDGHYSAGSTYKGALDTPITIELDIISRHLPRFEAVCVFIDDVRCFNSPGSQYKDYPPLDYLVDFARENQLTWSIEHDIFIARSAWRDVES